jgi:hypothetical protein
MALIELIRGPLDGQVFTIDDPGDILFFAGKVLIDEKNIRPGDHINRYEFRGISKNDRRHYVHMVDYKLTECDPDFLDDHDGPGGESEYGPI